MIFHGFCCQIIAEFPLNISQYFQILIQVNKLIIHLHLGTEAE